MGVFGICGKVWLVVVGPMKFVKGLDRVSGLYDRGRFRAWGCSGYCKMAMALSPKPDLPLFRVTSNA